MNNNINVLNPRTGQVDFSFKRPSLDFIKKESTRLRTSQESWANAPLAERISVMLKRKLAQVETCVVESRTSLMNRFCHR